MNKKEVKKKIDKLRERASYLDYAQAEQGQLVYEMSEVISDIRDCIVDIADMFESLLGEKKD